jgi:hypothetical protein
VLLNICTWESGGKEGVLRYYMYIYMYIYIYVYYVNGNLVGKRCKARPVIKYMQNTVNELYIYIYIYIYIYTYKHTYTQCVCVCSMYV